MIDPDASHAPSTAPAATPAASTGVEKTTGPATGDGVSSVHGIELSLASRDCAAFQSSACHSPSAVNPDVFWKPITAVRVWLPKLPSTVTDAPKWLSNVCNWRTASPVAPTAMSTIGTGIEAPPGQPSEAEP